jgi:hypothetical protein
MSGIQDFPQADHCMCDACKDGDLHWSDCAVHNMPAEPNGPCDCGRYNISASVKFDIFSLKALFYFMLFWLIYMLSGCATDQKIQRVEVPVIVPCVKSVPAKPDFETAHLLKTSSEGEKFLALARDYVRARIYEGGLEATIAGCRTISTP